MEEISEFLLQVILLEKPRGLDFTLRDQKLFQKSGGKYHGYSKTDERHLRDIFQKLDFSKGTWPAHTCYP